jgi:hypothetical protein
MKGRLISANVVGLCKSSRTVRGSLAHLPSALSKRISASFDCFERNNCCQLQNVSTELSVRLQFVTSLNNLEVQSKGVKWRRFVHSHWSKTMRGSPICCCCFGRWSLGHKFERVAINCREMQLILKKCMKFSARWLRALWHHSSDSFPLESERIF